METSTIFAHRLKELREEKGLSQAGLADELDISRGSISYYENAERTPDINVLVIFKEYFQVDFDYLLGYSSIRSREAADTSADVHQCFADVLKAVEKALMESKNTLIPGQLGRSFEELDYLREDIVSLIEAYHQFLDSAYRKEMDEKITKAFLDSLGKNNASTIINMGYRQFRTVPMMGLESITKKARGY